MSLSNLYTDRSKSENGCTFPASGQSVWFGSIFCGEGSESEYAITLGYDTDNVNELPAKGSADCSPLTWHTEIVDAAQFLPVLSKFDYY